MHGKTKCFSVMDNKSLSSRNKNLDTAVLSSNNNEINREFNQILKKVDDLKTSMNGLTSLIREVIERLDKLEKNSESLKVQSVLDECNTLEVFPIETAASLKEVESMIENNSAFKKNLITSLTQVTSADIKKTIRNILHYLITDEMAQKYSWLGQRHKAAYQNLQISKILTLVVQMRHQDITCEQISSVAAEWLKHAKQRAQRKSEKEKKCRKEETPPLSSNSSSDDSESDELNDECSSNDEH
ncbi:uncharacterized protein [Temnothorax longispinosus]|uniref:uncharacterized protein n=1 Tax=Temnothorax longispinosus TaxID=300112 RepID=UPI003A9A15FB